MDLWISALVGTVLLLGSFVCNSLKKKTAAPVYRYLTVILGVFSAVCYFCCASALLLILEID